MSGSAELGIVNVNGREPSVEKKLEIHRKVVALHTFRTTHRVILGDARRMSVAADEWLET